MQLQKQCSEETLPLDNIGYENLNHQDFVDESDNDLEKFIDRNFVKENDKNQKEHKEDRLSDINEKLESILKEIKKKACTTIQFGVKCRNCGKKNFRGKRYLCLTCD